MSMMKASEVVTRLQNKEDIVLTYKEPFNENELIQLMDMSNLRLTQMKFGDIYYLGRADHMQEIGITKMKGNILNVIYSIGKLITFYGDNVNYDRLVELDREFTEWYKLLNIEFKGSKK